MGFLTGGATNQARLERTVVDLIGEVTALRERIADLESGRGAVDRIAGEIRSMGLRLDAEIDKFGEVARQVVTLDRKLEEAEKSGETQRRKLVALAKSVEWETESLRKTLQVLLTHTAIVSDNGSRHEPKAQLPPAVEA